MKVFRFRDFCMYLFCANKWKWNLCVCLRVYAARRLKRQRKKTTYVTVSPWRAAT